MRTSEKLIRAYRRSLYLIVAMILVVLPIEVSFVFAGKVTFAMIGASVLLFLLFIGFGCQEDIKGILHDQQQDQLARSARAARTETVA